MLRKQNKQEFNIWLNKHYMKSDIVEILERTDDKYEDILKRYKEETEVLI